MIFTSFDGSFFKNIAEKRTERFIIKKKTKILEEAKGRLFRDNKFNEISDGKRWQFCQLKNTSRTKEWFLKFKLRKKSFDHTNSYASYG